MSDKDIRIDIKGRIDGPGGFKQAAGDAKDEIKDLNQLAAEAAKGQQLMAVAMGGVALAAAAAGTAVAGYAAIQVMAAKAYLEAADNLGTLAERYDMTTEQMSVMRLEAELGNTTIEKVAQGYQQLSIKMLAANSGSREAIALFKALGVEYQDGTGKLRAVDDVMNDLHDRFAGMERGAGRAATAAKVFGKGLADDLLPWLTQSSTEIQKVRNEAERLGLKISTETSQLAKQFNDDIKVLSLSAQGLGQALAVGVVENLARVTERMRAARNEGGLLHTVLEGLRQAGLELAGVGSDKQELDNVNLQLKRRQERMGVLQRKLEGGQNVRGDIRSLQGEIDMFERERNRLAANLAINNPTGYSEVPSGSGRTAAPDSIVKDAKEKKGRGPSDTGESLVIQLQNQLDALKHEATTYDKVQRQITDGTKTYSEENKEKALSLAKAVDAQKALNDESTRALHIQKLQEEQQQALEKAATDHHKALEREAQAMRESLDPWEAYLSTLKRLVEMREAGVLSADEFAAAEVRALDKVEDSYKKLAGAGTEAFDGLKNAIEGWGRDTSRTLAKAALDGKVSFESLGAAARSFVEELVAIQIKKRLMDPWLSAGTKALDGILGGGSPDVIPGGVSSVPYHSGRGPGEFGVPRYVHPAYYERAPRFHSGIGPGEMPAIIRQDESVLTPGQMRALGSRAPSVTIQVINQSSMPVQAEQRAPKFDGEGYVIGVVLRDLQRGGPIRDAMKQASGPVS